MIDFFCVSCGGLGNALMIGRAGFLSHQDTADRLVLLAKEVMPRLREFHQPNPAECLWWRSNPDK